MTAPETAPGQADVMHLMTIEMGAWCGAAGPGNGRASSQWREVTCPACTAKGTAWLRALAWDMLGTMGPSREALAFAVRAGRLGVTDEQGRPLAMACASEDAAQEPQPAPEPFRECPNCLASVRFGPPQEVRVAAWELAPAQPAPELAEQHARGAYERVRAALGGDAPFGEGFDFDPVRWQAIGQYVAERVAAATQPAPELAAARDASDLEVASIIAERNQLRMALQRLADDGNLEARDRLAAIRPELTGAASGAAPELAADPNHEPGLSKCGCRMCDWKRHGVAPELAAPIVLNMDAPGPAQPYEATLIPVRLAEPVAAQPAPELTAAMRVAETALDLLDDFTHAVIDYRGTSPAITAAARSVRTKAGLPPVEGR